MEALAKAEARLLLGRTALSLTVSRGRGGRYPTSLDALPQDIKAGAPTDPFTGKPIVYAARDDGFTLYSVGPDGRDDGGKSAMRGVSSAKGGDDIVWRRTK